MSLYYNFKSLVATRRPIMGHYIHYQDDGTGRDYYISTNNGGLQAKITAKPQPQSKERRWLNGFQTKNRSLVQQQSSASRGINHYVCDGSGRDSYIKSTDGGNTNNYGKDYLTKYQQGLRVWDTVDKQQTQKINNNSSLNQSDINNNSMVYRQNQNVNKLSKIQPRKYKRQPQDKQEQKHFTPNINDPYETYKGNFLNIISRQRSSSQSQPI